MRRGVLPWTSRAPRGRVRHTGEMIPRPRLVLCFEIQLESVFSPYLVWSFHLAGKSEEGERGKPEGTKQVPKKDVNHPFRAGPVVVAS